MFGLAFEPTITASAIIQTAILLAAMIRGWISLSHKIATMEGNIQNLQGSNEGFSKSFEQLSKVLTQVAVQDVRILAVEKRIDEIAHGKGFIK